MQKPTHDAKMLIDLLRGSIDQVAFACKIIDEYDEDDPDDQTRLNALCHVECVSAFEYALEKNMTDSMLMEELCSALTVITAYVCGTRLQDFVRAIWPVFLRNMHPQVVEAYCIVLGNVALVCDVCQGAHGMQAHGMQTHGIQTVIARGIFRRLLEIMQSYQTSSKVQGAVFWVLSNILTTEHQTLVDFDGNIHCDLQLAMLATMRMFMGDPMVMHEAMGAISGWLEVFHYPRAVLEFIKHGAVEVLVEFIGSTVSFEDRSVACTSLSKLLAHSAGRSIAVRCGAVPILLRAVSLDIHLVRILDALFSVTDIVRDSLVDLGDSIHPAICIDAAFLEPLCRLPNIHILKLNRIDDVEATFKMIASCDWIWHVDLSFSKVTNAQVGVLLQSAHLKILDLRGTFVDDDVAEYIVRSQSLREIQLTSTAFGDRGLKKLAESLYVTDVLCYETLVTRQGRYEAMKVSKGRARTTMAVLEGLEMLKHLPVEVLKIIRDYAFELNLLHVHL